MLQTQNVFANVNASNAREIANQIVVAATQAITGAGGWNFLYLAGVAANLAELENQFAANDNRPQAHALAANCESLATLAKTLTTKPNPVAGDLFALTSAMARTTAAAAAFADLFAP